jgi:hypothetical protein
MGVTVVALAMSLSGCKTIKPWEKEYLLSPLMDDAALSQLGSPFRGAALGSFEKLASAGGFQDEFPYRDQTRFAHVPAAERDARMRLAPAA